MGFTSGFVSTHSTSFPSLSSFYCITTVLDLHNYRRLVQSVQTNSHLQTGGATLTLGIAYLTVLAHERNRRAQAANLKSQSHILNSILDPTPLPPPRSRSELAREERSSLIETAKDRWNEEIENGVRRLQSMDWAEVREGMEGAVARLLGRGLEKGREGIETFEDKAKPLVQEAIDKTAATTIARVERARNETKEGVQRISGAVREKSEKALAKAKEEVDQARVKAGGFKDAAKSASDRAVADIKTGANDGAESIRHSRETVDTARGAVRGVVQKGIERGKKAVGQAKAAVGLAEERWESKNQSKVLSHSSAVERALHERFETAETPEKSVEETLAERYKPIDERGDSNLKRG